MQWLRGLLAALVIGLVAPVASHAAMITGNVSLDGPIRVNTTAQTITFGLGTPTEPLNRANFEALNGFVSTLFTACNDCVVTRTSPVSYAGGTIAPGLLWSLTQGGNTLQFLLDPGSVVSVFGPANLRQMSISGSGIFRMTGFEDTVASFGFTSQGINLRSNNFSASFAAVPVPAAIALMGVGLLGLGLVRRRG